MPSRRHERVKRVFSDVGERAPSSWYDGSTPLNSEEFTVPNPYSRKRLSDKEFEHLSGGVCRGVAAGFMRMHRLSPMEDRPGFMGTRMSRCELHRGRGGGHLTEWARKIVFGKSGPAKRQQAGVCNDVS